MPVTSDVSVIERTLRSILCDVLGLDRSRVDDFNASTELFGSLPEFDSMAIAGVLTQIEERFAVVIDDDEVDAELFGTYGNLLTFTKAKTLT